MMAERKHEDFLAMMADTWSYHLGARIQGPAQAQLLQIEK